MAINQTIEFEVRVTNFYPIRDLLNELSSEGYYRGAIKEAITQLLDVMTEYAKKVTHKGKSGMLAKSHMWEYDSHAMRGRIFLDPRIVYATGATLRWPSIYGVYEHARGGDHAFYERTYQAFTRHPYSPVLRALVQSVPRI